MKLEFVRQESNSREELLLRTFWGYFYIAIPHIFVMFFVQIWVAILAFVAWWAILFTGKYPENMYIIQMKLLRWNLRLSARLTNLLDGYPAIGLNKEDPKIIFEAPMPSTISRGNLLLKSFFGWIYVIIPHGFLLYFRMIFTYILLVFVWFEILFKGKVSEGNFEYVVGMFRWSTRLSMYYGLWISDKYPPFNGRPDPEQAPIS